MMLWQPELTSYTTRRLTAVLGLQRSVDWSRASISLGTEREGEAAGACLSRAVDVALRGAC